MGLKDRHASSRSEGRGRIWAENGNVFAKEKYPTGMNQLTGIMKGHSQAPPTTYFLMSSVGENVQYQHGSSLGMLIFSVNRYIALHKNPMAFWAFHFRYWIASSSSTFFHLVGLANWTCPSTSVQGHQIETHILVGKPKLSKSQTVQYLFAQKW